MGSDVTGIPRSLRRLHEESCGGPIESVEVIRADGSDRKIFRLTAGDRSVVGISNQHRGENEAFVEFTRSFGQAGLPVPEILAARLDEGVYIESDLGDETLADRLELYPPAKGKTIPRAVWELLEESVTALARFQFEGHHVVDYEHCYQDERFSPETAEGDLRYFQEAFLARFYRGSVDALRLATDFRSLLDRVGADGNDHFLYRDFQPRNIMLTAEGLRFIDYQSGRRGPPAYDFASFVSSSTLASFIGIEERLLDCWSRAIAAYPGVNVGRIRASLPALLLVRCLQALGAYGNLGVAKGRVRFLRFIPPRIELVARLLNRPALKGKLPALHDLFQELHASPPEYEEGDRS